MRGGHGAAVLAVIAIGLGLTPAAAGAGGGPVPNYVTPGIGYFTLYANKHWIANGAPARQFSSSFRPAPLLSYPIAGGDAARWIWASSCSAGRQRVEFQRTVSLPGQPERLQFAVLPTVPTHNGLYWQNPLRSVTLLVNGTVVAKASGTALHSGELNDDLYGPTLPHAFRFGTNKVAVIVVKRANPSYLNTCGSSNAASRLGIALGLVGQGFVNDLAVKKPTAAQAVKYFRIQPGQRKAFQFTFTVTNNGPSASRVGTFGMGVQPGFMVMSSDPNNDKYFPFSIPIDASAGLPFSGCTNPTARSVACTYDTWLAPGQSTSVKVAFSVAAPTDEPLSDIEQMDVGWGISPTNEERDQTAGNDTASFDAYFCYPQATDPKCPPAT